MLNENSKDITVNEVLIPKINIPLVYENDIVKKGIELMCQFNLGIVCIISKNSDLIGVFTDGDIRRSLLTTQKPLSALFVDDILDYAVRTPIFVSNTSKLVDAINIMEKNQIWDLPVLNRENKLLGLLHLHPALKKLINQK